MSLARSVLAFAAADDVSGDDRHTQTVLRSSIATVRAALEMYGTDGLAVSYNGGKDCLVLVLVLLAAIEQASGEHTFDRAGWKAGIPTAHVRVPAGFAAVDEFVASSAAQLGLAVSSFDMPMRDAFELFLRRRPTTRAIMVGTRRTDPRAANLAAFDPTDGGWPDFVRVHPVLEWRYRDVWNFIKAVKADYCPLYNLGYTSLGGRKDTIRNPSLEQADKSYLPASELKTDQDERLGRGITTGTPISASPPPRTVLVALSGPSSSGKTTVARALCSIFSSLAKDEACLPPRLFHQDDFYVSTAEIPVNPATGIQNWDSPASFNMDGFRQTLAAVKTGDFTGVERAMKRAIKSAAHTLETDESDSTDGADWVKHLQQLYSQLDSGDITPTSFSRKIDEFLNSPPADPPKDISLPPTLLALLTTRLRTVLAEPSRLGLKQQKILPAMADGILLFPPSVGLSSLYDLRMFFATDKTTVSTRRAGRFYDLTAPLSVSPDDRDDEPEVPSPESNPTSNGIAQEAAEDGDWWVDPPGYVDNVVWPEYLSAHSFLLVPDSNDDGMADVDVAEYLGITLADGSASIAVLLVKTVEMVVDTIRGDAVS